MAVYAASAATTPTTCPMRLSPRTRAPARARTVWTRRTSESDSSRTPSQSRKNPWPGLLSVPMGRPRASASASAATARPSATAAMSRVIGRRLLRSGDDAPEGVPLLPPGRFELLAALELDVVAELADLLLELLVLGDLAECALELGHDRRRHALGPHDRAPHGEDHVDAFFLERRRLRQLADARRAGHCERPHLARGHLGHELGGERERRVGVTAEHGQRGRATAIERDVVVLEAGRLGDHAHGVVAGAPRPRIGEVELPRILLHEVE